MLPAVEAPHRACVIPLSAPRPWDSRKGLVTLELPRFGGHLSPCGQGVHDAEITSAVPA
jgi:hypothetical protein